MAETTEETTEETGKETTKAKKGKPALLPDMPRAGIRPSQVGRRVKMLRPICATCQRGKDTPEDWWRTCTHNPYVTIAQKTSKVPVYEDLEGGRKKLVGTDTIVEWFEQPNWVQVSATPRINHGVEVSLKRARYGFILPEEVRSPEFPDGIANCCEYRDCRIQTNLKTYRWGRFCRLLEAQLVGHDARMSGGGGALEIGEGPQNLEKQRAQLEEVPV